MRIEVLVDRGLPTEEHLKFQVKKVYCVLGELILDGWGVFKDKFFFDGYARVERIQIHTVPTVDGNRRVVFIISGAELKNKMYMEDRPIRGYCPSVREFLEGVESDGVEVKISQKLKKKIDKFLLAEAI